jgi:hypothetical protein
MLVRRYRARRRAAEIAGRRLIDAYAIPMAPGGVRTDDEPLDPPRGSNPNQWIKICPACGCRYAHNYRTCARDDSELAALN